MKQLTKILLGFALLSYVGFSCSITIPRAINENPLGSSIGKSTRTTYLGIIQVGEDASIEQAAKNGNIKSISTVDYQVTDLLGLITTQTVIVTGSQEIPVAVALEKVEEQKPTPKIYNAEEKKEIEVKTQAVNTTPPAKVAPETRTEVAAPTQEPAKSVAVQKNPPTESATKPVPSAEAPMLAKAERKEVKRVEIAEEEVSFENKDTNKRIKGFSIKSKTLSDFSKKIRETSSEYMQYGDLTPIDIQINISTLSFSCNFIQKTSGFIKMGLFYGPKSVGCESCESVINNNPGSKVLARSSNSVFVSQLIGVYSK